MYITVSNRGALSFTIGSISKVSRKPFNFVLFTVIRCGYPGHLLNGHVIGRSYLFGDVIHYSCHEGYKLQGMAIPVVEFSREDTKLDRFLAKK